MPDIRLFALFTLLAVLIAGTTYSVVHDTYVDTSNPSLTHLSHHLHATHYFASKNNFVNVYFLKWAWAWTTGAFFASWLTSPPQTRTRNRLFKWVAESLVWLVFTGWFFGPSIMERVILASGGECVLSLPSGEYLTLPGEYCAASSAISPTSHPDLFTSTYVLPSGWTAKARLRKGHDVSGHTFLLTMATLFLVDQLRPSFQLKKWSIQHRCAVLLQLALIGLWIMSTGTTSLYFHVPYEKFTGFVIGTVGFLISQVIPNGPDFKHSRVD